MFFCRFAVITLNERIEFSGAYGKVQRPIKLADYDFVGRALANVTGYGKTEKHLNADSEILRIAKMEIVDADTCRSLEPSFGTIDRSQICGLHNLKSRSCKGDSGSPVVVDNKLVGVVSTGSAYCEASQPDVFTNVYRYRAYIRACVREVYPDAEV